MDPIDIPPVMEPADTIDDVSGVTTVAQQAMFIIQSVVSNPDYSPGVSAATNYAID